jgi:serine/threonine protein kinase
MKVIDKAAPERETVCSIATATSKEEDKCEKVKHSIEREVVIMKLIQHPNVIQLYDVYEDSENMYVPCLLLSIHRRTLTTATYS